MIKPSCHTNNILSLFAAFVVFFARQRVLHSKQLSDCHLQRLRKGKTQKHKISITRTDLHNIIFSDGMPSFSSTNCSHRSQSTTLQINKPVTDSEPVPRFHYSEQLELVGTFRAAPQSLPVLLSHGTPDLLCLDVGGRSCRGGIGGGEG